MCQLPMYIEETQISQLEPEHLTSELLKQGEFNLLK